MQNRFSSGWDGYRLLDSGSGERLERFGEYILCRPDPQALWDKTLPEKEWQGVDACFKPKTKSWQTFGEFSGEWTLDYHRWRYLLKLTLFKHTGLFPEQHWQWDWVYDQLRGSQARVLNLFGYTGALSLAALSSKATVTHVDASKPALSWARENQRLSKLQKAIIRYIPEDALIFTQREKQRGHQYDAIIMDPPVYGHGPKGEVWDFNKHFPELLNNCIQLLSNRPLFILVNAYAVSMSSVSLGNIIFSQTKPLGGRCSFGEIGIQEQSAGRVLSTGIYALWENKVVGADFATATSAV